MWGRCCKGRGRGGAGAENSSCLAASNSLAAHAGCSVDCRCQLLASRCQTLLHPVPTQTPPPPPPQHAHLVAGKPGEGHGLESIACAAGILGGAVPPHPHHPIEAVCREGQACGQAQASRWHWFCSGVAGGSALSPSLAPATGQPTQQPASLPHPRRAQHAWHAHLHCPGRCEPPPPPPG